VAATATAAWGTAIWFPAAGGGAAAAATGPTVGSGVYRSDDPTEAGVGDAGVMMGERGTAIGSGTVELRAEDVGVGQWIVGRAWCVASSSWNEGNDEKEEAEEW